MQTFHLPIEDVSHVLRIIALHSARQAAIKTGSRLLPEESKPS